MALIIQGIKTKTVHTIILGRKSMLMLSVGIYSQSMVLFFLHYSKQWMCQQSTHVVEHACDILTHIHHHGLWLGTDVNQDLKRALQQQKTQAQYSADSWYKTRDLQEADTSALYAMYKYLLPVAMATVNTSEIDTACTQCMLYVAQFPVPIAHCTLQSII